MKFTSINLYWSWYVCLCDYGFSCSSTG